MEQTAATLSYADTMLNNFSKPVVVKNVTLLAPGIWTGVDGRPTRFTEEEIKNGYDNTDWEGMNLFLDHKDTKGSAAAYWIGFVKNARLENGNLIGDVEIWHPMFAMFIKTAKASFGVSMTMDGREHLSSSADTADYSIYSFSSCSLVDEPGCEVSWLPKMLSSSNKNNKSVVGGEISVDNIKALAKVSNFEETRNSMKMSVSEFYAVPRDPPSSSSLPIFDASHVRNAISRFSQTNFDNPSQKKTAWNKIIKAANKFNVEVSKEMANYYKDHDSEKNLASSNDPDTSIVEESSDNVQSCKEVEKMTDEVNQESKEEHKEEEVIEEESKDETEVTEESQSSDKASGEDEVKELASKVSKLDSKFDSLAKLVQKSLAAKEESEEESKEETEEDSDDKLESVKSELEETKKELAKARAELDAPDEKSLAAGRSNSPNADSNAGMLGFLKNNANLNY